MRKRYALFGEVRGCSFLSFRAQLLRVETLFEYAWKFFGLHTELRADLFGPQPILVFGHQSHDSVESRRDFVGRTARKASSAFAVREHPSGSIRAPTHVRTRFAEKLVERCTPYRVYHGIGE